MEQPTATAPTTQNETAAEKQLEITGVVSFLGELC